MSTLSTESHIESALLFEITSNERDTWLQDSPVVDCTTSIETGHRLKERWWPGPCTKLVGTWSEPEYINSQSCIGGSKLQTHRLWKTSLSGVCGVASLVVPAPQVEHICWLQTGPDCDPLFGSTTAVQVGSTKVGNIQDLGRCQRSSFFKAALNPV